MKATMDEVVNPRTMAAEAAEMAAEATQATGGTQAAEASQVVSEAAQKPASDGGTIALIPGAALGLAGTAGGVSLSVPMPFQNRIVLFDDMCIANTTHVGGIDRLVATLTVGQQLTFQRQPDNLRDAWAIRVFAGDNCLGYVPCDQNEVLARLMDGGKSIGATVTAKEKFGKWNKIHMEVYLDD